MAGNKKRGVEEASHGTKKRTDGGTFSSDNGHQESEQNLVFEDPFGDDMEDEEMIDDNDDDDENDNDEDEQGMDMDDESKVQDEEDEPVTQKRVFLPGVDKLGEDEELDYDPSAYDMYYAMSAEWPSLSFDILSDSLGACRTKFPMTMYLVAGSQATNAQENQITVMKMSDLHKTKHKDPDDSDDDDDDDDSDDEAMDGDPILESRSVAHVGGVNRIRAMPQSSQIVATWADTGKVHLWDISSQLASLDGKAGAGPTPPKNQNVFTFTGHADEGFAMDWSPVDAGKLLTGDCKKFIYLWQHAQSSWQVDKIPFTSHQASVEDLQWSPTESSVFASCSADQTVRIWDTRRKNGSMLDWKAHDDDVNVISWNHNVAYLLASGSDDGSFKIWDLRNLQAKTPVAHFRYHTAPITSLEWHPSDESVLAVAGADNQVSIWDLSVEDDQEEPTSAAAAASAPATVPDQPKLDLPPQLLFIHQGQTDIKELHFHRQCPGVMVSTASDGFNVLKPANIS